MTDFEPDWDELMRVAGAARDEEWNDYPTDRQLKSVITEYLKQLDEAGFEIKKKEIEDDD